MTIRRERLNAPVWGSLAAASTLTLAGGVELLSLGATTNYLMLFNSGVNTVTVTPDNGGDGGLILSPGESFGFAVLAPSVYVNGTAGQTLRITEFRD